jgi:hypothetical protein
MQIVREAKEGKNISKTYDNIEELFSDLQSKD